MAYLRKRKDQGQKALLPDPSLPPVYFPPHDHSCEWHFNSTNKDEKQGRFSYFGIVFFLTGEFKN